MAYTPTSWTPGVFGTEITSARLNNIETGIVNAVTIGRDSINILDYGVVEGDASSANDSTNTTNLQAAIDAAASQKRKLIFPGGTFRFSGTLTFAGAVCWEGAGRGRTVLKYTGSGSAITNNSAGTRRYELSMSRFSLTTTTGTVGLDLDSVSTSEFSTILVSGFSTANVDIYSSTDGGCVYNRFWNVTSQSSPIGFRNRASSSNANTWVSCRALLCTSRGWSLEDSNDCTIEASQAEESGVGIYITGTTSGANDSHRIKAYRSEHNTTGIEIASVNVRYTDISGYWFDSSTTNPILDSGFHTRRAATQLYMASSTIMACESGVQFSSGGNVNLGTTSSALQAATNGAMYIRGNAPDGSTAVGAWIGNGNTLSTAGGKIVGFCKDGPVAHAQPVAYIGQDGSYQFASGPTISAGSGTPEGVVTAAIGSLFLRTNGGTGTTLYVKESGAGNTGWVAK